MYERLLKLIKENLPTKDITNASMDSHLVKDLGMDSIGMMMLSMAIEEEFGLIFDELVRFETVKDVIAYLEIHATK